ncbi:hypothetical protein OGAPHI_003839 [Ogataea philodendri]|uniref:Calcineurin-like phosphoesterase domain-containing protein n=1 Tax=Ogataea philodendri TaxID=1378263 RepID=A0A9P8P5W9_9ASCO|nr:uncharacterized protein OGAPHI_003839 [Ogataea philodendri]KAH3665651.1 hypothetical protein OGAPHI_003839 [Ogataea philodendri]
MDSPVVLDLEFGTCYRPFCKESEYLRIDKDLELGKSFLRRTYLSKQLGRDEETAIVDLSVGKPEHRPGDVWESKGQGLWAKYGPISHAIEDITVLFAPTDPRPGWNIVTTPLDTDTSHNVYVSYKKTVKSPSKPQLAFNKQNKFKILQVADLHFSTLEGVCLDPWPKLSSGEYCEADLRTTEFVETVLELEKPDLVVMTGDQVFGDDSPDSETTILKVCDIFERSKVPYAMVFGNHDDEGSLDRQQLMDIVETLPYSLATDGPANVSGVGNYVIQVQDKLALYFMDSHKYSLNPKVRGYDFLKQDQRDWIESVKVDVPQAMAFFHIPLPEYRETQKIAFGNYKEGITAPQLNSGMAESLKEVGVSVVSVGHDHCNDYCLQSDLWMCYGGGAGEGGYAGYGGTERRVRVFEVDSTASQIATWQRLRSDPETVVEHHLLASNTVSGPLATDLAGLQLDPAKPGTVDFLSSSKFQGLNNLYRIEKYGYEIGYKITDCLIYKKSVEEGVNIQLVDVLEVMKFICRDVWRMFYLKQMDNLRTNHIGTFVLIDNHFRPLLNVSSANGDADTLAKIQPYLQLPCGLIRGILASLGISALVKAEVIENSLPAVSFNVQTTVSK